MADSVNTETKDIKDLTLEEATAALKELLGHMDSQDLTLEQNFRLYERGLSLVKACNEKLDKIEKQIIILEEGSHEA